MKISGSAHVGQSVSDLVGNPEDLGLQSQSEGLEKPRIEPVTPGLQGKWLNHCAAEASMVKYECAKERIHQNC